MHCTGTESNTTLTDRRNGIFDEKNGQILFGKESVFPAANTFTNILSVNLIVLTASNERENAHGSISHTQKNTIQSDAEGTSENFLYYDANIILLDYTDSPRLLLYEYSP